MKPPPFILALAGAFAIGSSAHADYEIRISMSSPLDKTTKEYTTKIKGTHVRTELGDGSCMISDQKTGLRVRLDDQKKQATDLSDFYKSAQTARDPAKERPKPVPTGRKEIVNGYEAEEYTYEIDSGMKIAAWVARDYPKDKAEALTAIFSASSSLSSRAVPDLAALPGPVIRSVVTDKSGTINMTSDIKSVKETTFDDKEFEVPADYTVKKLPARPVRPGLKKSPSAGQ